MTKRQDRSRGERPRGEPDEGERTPAAGGEGSERAPRWRPSPPFSDDDLVDESGIGSFPASDPPPWTLGCPEREGR